VRHLQLCIKNSYASVMRIRNAKLMPFTDMKVQVVAKNSENAIKAHLPNDQEEPLT